MRRLPLLAVLPLAACVAPKAPPPPAAPSAPVVALPAPEAGRDWRDAPLSPGTWRYVRQGDGSAAIWGQGARPDFAVRCGPDRQVTLVRGSVSPAERLTVTTSFGVRTLAVGAVGGGIGAPLAARDPLLDQMVFSRGRYMVEGAGPRLILPAWAEIARVVEDCRG